MLGASFARDLSYICGMNEVILSALRWRTISYKHVRGEKVVLIPDANGYVWRVPDSAFTGLDDIPLESIPLVLASKEHLSGHAHMFWNESTVPYLSKRLELGI